MTGAANSPQSDSMTADTVTAAVVAALNIEHRFVAVHDRISDVDHKRQLGEQASASRHDATDAVLGRVEKVVGRFGWGVMGGMALILASILFPHAHLA
jgi:hypothetical protein